MIEAPARERDALTELVAARKFFQKSVSDNPGAFANADEEEGAPIKLAIDESKKLREIAEFRNEAKAGRDLVLPPARHIDQRGSRGRALYEDSVAVC